MNSEDDDNGGCGNAHAHRTNVNSVVDDDDEILRMIKQPPSIPDNTEELDTCDACLVELDGHELKKKSSGLYNAFVHFSYDCRRKIVLKKFSCPSQNVDGGLVSWEGKKLETRSRKFCHEIAEEAVTIYNRLSKDGKLKLEKLIKVNANALDYYMTFSAINTDTGKSGIYQAALTTLGVREYVLGLLRDWSNDKILAILSITGADEDLASLRKQLIR